MYCVLCPSHIKHLIIIGICYHFQKWICWWPILCKVLHHNWRGQCPTDGALKPEFTIDCEAKGFSQTPNTKVFTVPAVCIAALKLSTSPPIKLERGLIQISEGGNGYWPNPPHQGQNKPPSLILYSWQEAKPHIN